MSQSRVTCANSLSKCDEGWYVFKWCELAHISVKSTRFCDRQHVDMRGMTSRLSSVLLAVLESKPLSTYTAKPRIGICALWIVAPLSACCARDHSEMIVQSIMPLLSTMVPIFAALVPQSVGFDQHNPFSIDFHLEVGVSSTIFDVGTFSNARDAVRWNVPSQRCQPKNNTNRILWIFFRLYCAKRVKSTGRHAHRCFV